MGVLLLGHDDVGTRTFNIVDDYPAIKIEIVTRMHPATSSSVLESD